MRALIVAATQEEIAQSIPFLHKTNIPYLITGVGMVATTFALTRYLSTHPCELIINVGIAGAIDKSLTIGELVEIEKDTFAELGAEDDEKFLSIQELGFGHATYNNIAIPNLNTKLVKVEGITVNKVHGREFSITELQHNFPNAAVESMEGAATFFVAQQFNIPIIQVRSISNYVEKRDKNNWNIPLAIQNINSWICNNLLKKLIN